MSEPEKSAPSLLAGANAALGLATLGALAVVLPATLRVSGSVGFVSALLGLWGALALTLGPTAAALRIARPLPRTAWCVPLGLALSLAPLVLFARILIVSTHHRPLGGATFAFVSAGLLAGAVAVAARVISWSAKKPDGMRRYAAVGLGALGLLAGAVLLLPALSSPVRASLLDGVLAATACVIAAVTRVPPALERALMRAGIGLWLLAVVSSLALGLASPEVRAALDASAPVLLGLAGWLRG